MALLDGRDRRIVELAVPALATLAIEPLYVLVDTAIVGRLGATPLGGLALATTVLTTSLYVCNFLSFGTTARVAFLTGRGDRPGAAAAAVQGLWICLLLGVPLAVLVASSARPLAAALGGDGDVLDAAVTYLRISALGMPCVLVAFVGQGHLRGLSDTRTPLLVVAVANGVNVALEVLLVHGFELGIAGSAWGTVVAQAIAAAWFLRISGARARAAGVVLGPRWAEIRGLLTVGRHLLVRTGALLTTFTIATAVAARLGDGVLGGHQIALQVTLFLALSVDALAVAAQALVGTALGAGDVAEAEVVTRRSLRLGFVAGGALAAAVLVTSPVLPRVFTGDDDVVRAASVALVFVAAMQLPGAVAFVLDGALMGGSDFRYLQFAMLAALAVFVPVAVAAGIADLGIAGLWAAMLAWMCARAVGNGSRLRSGRWLDAAA